MSAAFEKYVINSVGAGYNKRQAITTIQLSGMGYVHGLFLNGTSYVPVGDGPTTKLERLSDYEWISDIVWLSRPLEHIGAGYNALGYLKLEIVDCTDPAKPVRRSIETGEIRDGETPIRLTEKAGLKSLRVVAMATSTGTWFDGFEVDIVPNYAQQKPIKSGIDAILKSWGRNSEVTTTTEETLTHMNSFMQSSARELSVSVAASIEADYFVKAKLEVGVEYTENSAEEAREEHMRKSIATVATKYTTGKDECLLLIAQGDMHKPDRPGKPAVFIPTGQARYATVSLAGIKELNTCFDLVGANINFPTGWDKTLEAYEEPKTKLRRYRMRAT